MSIRTLPDNHQYRNLLLKCTPMHTKNNSNNNINNNNNLILMLRMFNNRSRNNSTRMHTWTISSSNYKRNPDRNRNLKCNHNHLYIHRQCQHISISSHSRLIDYLNSTLTTTAINNR